MEMKAYCMGMGKCMWVDLLLGNDVENQQVMLHNYTYRSLWSMRSYIHTMLCANLFVAQLVFMIGIDRVGNEVREGVIFVNKSVCVIAYSSDTVLLRHTLQCIISL